MKKTKRIYSFLLTLLILVVCYALHIFYSTGYFRSIENQFEGQILKKIKLKGAEDIVISHVDSFAIVSSTDRANFPNMEQETGGLYLIDLRDPNYEPIHLTKDFPDPFAPHGISIFKKDSIYTLAAVNHTMKGEFIEFFELSNQRLVHKHTLKNPLIYSPNDLVLLDETRFYLTNDHNFKEGLGKIAEDYLGLELSNVIYFDGNNFIEVADGIAYANGINFDNKRNLLFVASPRGFRIKVYQKNLDGALTFIEDIDCGTGVDNIEFDEDGKLWIGSHPNLLTFASYAKGKRETSPSEIIEIDYKDKGDYVIRQIYMDDGKNMSGSSVAAPFGNLIFAGNVMDQHFLILEKK